MLYTKDIYTTCATTDKQRSYLEASIDTASNEHICSNNLSGRATCTHRRYKDAVATIRGEPVWGQRVLTSQSSWQEVRASTCAATLPFLILLVRKPSSSLPIMTLCQVTTPIGPSNVRAGNAPVPFTEQTCNKYREAHLRGGWRSF